MPKERNSINEINKVCKAVLKLQESDFFAIEEVIAQQAEYNSPLKMATNIRQSRLAEHNRRVVDSLRGLREVILLGSDIPHRSITDEGDTDEN